MAGVGSVSVNGLQPNQNYTVQVYIRRTVNGVVTHSKPTPIAITTKANPVGGYNFKVTNGGTDVQLLGGTIYAGTFDDGLGQFNPMDGSTDPVKPANASGTTNGVALNQFGVAAYASGEPTFYINSTNGNAYFGGTLSIGSIQDAGGATTDQLGNYRSKYTKITGGDIATGIIHSTNFNSDNQDIWTDSTKTYLDPTKLSNLTTGSAFDLDNGIIVTPNFYINGTEFDLHTANSGTRIEINTNAPNPTLGTAGYSGITFYGNSFPYPGSIKTSEINSTSSITIQAGKYGSQDSNPYIQLSNNTSNSNKIVFWSDQIQIGKSTQSDIPSTRNIIANLSSITMPAADGSQTYADGSSVFWGDIWLSY